MDAEQAEWAVAVARWVEAKHDIFCCAAMFGSRTGSRFRGPPRPDSDLDLSLRSRDDPADLAWYPARFAEDSPAIVWGDELTTEIGLTVQIHLGRPGDRVWPGLIASGVLVWRAANYECLAADCMCRAVARR